MEKMKLDDWKKLSTDSKRSFFLKGGKTFPEDFERVDRMGEYAINVTLGEFQLLKKSEIAMEKKRKQDKKKLQI